MGIDQINANISKDDWTALRRCLQQIKHHLSTSSGSLMSSGLFDANTILKADADNTPEALAIPAQTLVGRITGGEITALTVAEVQTLLSGFSHSSLSGLSAAGAHPGTSITNTPAGNIAATTVQAAINELDASQAAPQSSVRITVTSISHGLVAGDCVYLIP